MNKTNEGRYTKEWHDRILKEVDKLEENLYKTISCPKNDRNVSSSCPRKEYYGSCDWCPGFYKPIEFFDVRRKEVSEIAAETIKLLMRIPRGEKEENYSTIELEKENDFLIILQQVKQRIRYRMDILGQSY